MNRPTLIRLRDVMAKTGFKRAWIYKLMDRNEFPQSVKLGIRSVAWVESEIDEWISNKIKQRDGVQ
ncbi:AlpA family transcriptional regulator [Pantoea sp. App145]|uniref:AlpA family transcriptional regulator n=1 Tax=Pantoea sp. App145 TaxID=3071567 RepID=UPI003A805AFC